MLIDLIILIIKKPGILKYNLALYTSNNENQFIPLF